VVEGCQADKVKKNKKKKKKKLKKEGGVNCFREGGVGLLGGREEEK